MSTISSEQALRIRNWLVDQGFRPDEAQDSHSEQWIYDDRLVRLTFQGERARVDICHGIDSGWQELSELAKLRTGWPEASTMSPIELATAPQLHPHRDHLTFRRAPGRWFYERGQPWAHGVKVLLQMIVGIGAVIDIGRHVAHSVMNSTASSPLAPTVTVSVEVIAYALAVAAAIELAYTLFTPGPDEALDPLMLGLASGILLLLTSDAVPVTARYFGVLMGVLGLAGLFLIRRYLLREDDE